MKKRFAIIAAALALVLALPATALAAEYSPVSLSATDNKELGDSTSYVKAEVIAGSSGSLRIDATDDLATHMTLETGDKVAGSFDLYTVGSLTEEDVRNMTVTISVNPNYAGHAIKLFMEPSGGYAGETYEGTLSSTGSYTFSITHLGILTFTVGDKVVGPIVPGGDEPTSPQTGADPMMAVVAVATLLCAAGAVVLARSLRKEHE